MDMKRCGKCYTCREKVCNTSKGSACNSCLNPSYKKGCKLRSPCIKQAANQAKPVATTGGDTTASEGEDTPRYLTRSKLSEASDSSIDPDTTSGMISVVGNIVDNLLPFSAITNTVPESVSASVGSNNR